MAARQELIARQLAALFVSGDWTTRALEASAAQLLGAKRRKSQTQLVANVIANCPTPYAPSPQWLVDFLLKSSAFNRAARPLLQEGLPARAVLKPPMFSPAPAFADLGAPALSTPGYLADWLGVSLQHLDWLADSKHQHVHTAIPILQHYHYAWVRKRSGALRLIEAPKPRLKAIQRRVLREILDLGPVSRHAHGFVRGRSCIGGAQIHAGEHIVVTLDLKNFFPSIAATRIHGLFRLFGYPWAVARLLTGLCTTSTPSAVFDHAADPAARDCAMSHIFAAPHLAQGAPTSPALANAAAWRLDQRLAGLAGRAGANFTRYADDLAFSGDEEFARRLGSFLRSVDRIVRDEGFSLNAGKTRIMRRSARQRVTGVVVNQHVNVTRESYDQLKATLFNCMRNGPTAENREAHADFRAHLDGRVGWVETLNPRRGERLRRLFDAIKW